MAPSMGQMGQYLSYFTLICVWIAMPSTAELRLLEGDRHLSTNYRRLLSVRLSKRVSRAMALVGDPSLEHYRNLAHLESLASHLAHDRMFRKAFLESLQGIDGSIPIWEEST